MALGSVSGRGIKIFADYIVQPKKKKKKKESLEVGNPSSPMRDPCGDANLFAYLGMCFAYPYPLAEPNGLWDPCCEIPVGFGSLAPPPQV